VDGGSFAARYAFDGLTDLSRSPSPLSPFAASPWRPLGTDVTRHRFSLYDVRLTKAVSAVSYIFGKHIVEQEKERKRERGERRDSGESVLSVGAYRLERRN